MFPRLPTPANQSPRACNGVLRGPGQIRLYEDMKRCITEADTREVCRSTLEADLSGNNENYGTRAYDVCIISENGIGSGTVANRVDIPVRRGQDLGSERRATVVGVAMAPPSATLPSRYATSRSSYRTPRTCRKTEDGPCLFHHAPVCSCLRSHHTTLYHNNMIQYHILRTVIITWPCCTTD